MVWSLPRLSAKSTHALCITVPPFCLQGVWRGAWLCHEKQTNKKKSPGPKSKFSWKGHRLLLDECKEEICRAAVDEFYRLSLLTFSVSCSVLFCS